jgi:hypothetical protein
MRISSRLAPLALAALVVLAGACGQKQQKGTYIPATGTAKVKPHDDLPRNHTYCRYKITALPATGAQMKVGDIVCIYCPPAKSGCDNYSKIEELQGTTYDVSAMDSSSACTTCPKGDATPPGWPREMQ